MPKVKQSLTALVSEFENVFDCCDDSLVLCNVCRLTLVHPTRWSLLRHINSEKHQTSLVRVSKSEVQSRVTTALLDGKTLSKFNADLCKTLLETDIPLTKLNHPSLRKFLETYTEHKCPDESTLRKYYIDSIYQQKLQTIRSEIGEVIFQSKLMKRRIQWVVLWRMLLLGFWIRIKSQKVTY